MVVETSSTLCTLIVAYLCLENYTVFCITKANRILTVKQEAYILSIKSSITLFILSLVFMYKYVTCNTGYCESLSDDTRNLQILTVLTFLSYLISDCVIGYFYYHKYMCSLSGYLHHFVYIVLNILAIYTNNFPLFVLFLIEELPTFLMGIGSFNSKFRSNMMFGIAFFITRILLHIYLIYQLKGHSYMVSGLAISVLPMHIYWFYGWLKKYAFNKHV